MSVVKIEGHKVRPPPPDPSNAELRTDPLLTPGPTTLRLRVVSDHRRSLAERSSAVFSVEGGTIGRSTDNDWVLPDPLRYVSAHHARVQFRDGHFYLQDISTNGVYVNDDLEPIARRGGSNGYRLANGDVVRMGKFLIVAVLEELERGDTDDAAAVPTSIPVLRSLTASKPDIGASLNVDELPVPDAAPAPVLPVNAHGQVGDSGKVRALAESVQAAPAAAALTSAPDAPDAPDTPDAPGLAERSAQPAEAAREPKASGLPFEAAVLREAGLLSPAYEGFKLAREYRYIKRALIARALGRGASKAPNGYLVMIASAVSSEGKSFTAVNLALSLSLEKDLRVLLVDADVARPHISRVLGLAEAPGLLDVLRDPQLSVDRVILQTNIATLSFLPAGKPSAEATELLASRRMQQVAAALSEHDSQRIVLFDSPPLLQSNESHALTQIAGQIIVVVRAGSTPQHVLLDALEVLKNHPAVALVLNQSMQPAASPYYYYGHGSERSQSP